MQKTNFLSFISNQNYALKFKSQLINRKRLILYFGMIIL